MATASEEGGPFTIQFAPTIARWRDQTEDAERVLGFKYPNAACQLALFVHLDTSTASASIKLRIPVGFKEIRSKVNAFVIVHPDRIRIPRTRHTRECSGRRPEDIGAAAEMF